MSLAGSILISSRSGYFLRAVTGRLGKCSLAAATAATVIVAHQHRMQGRNRTPPQPFPSFIPPRAAPPQRQMVAWSALAAGGGAAVYGRGPGRRPRAPRNHPLRTGRTGVRAHRPRRVDHRWDARRQLEEQQDGGPLLRRRNRRTRRRGALSPTAYGATKRPRLANRRNKVGASGCSPSSLRECPTLCASSYSRPVAG